jgi:hypothetical protein
MIDYGLLTKGLLFLILGLGLLVTQSGTDKMYRKTVTGVLLRCGIVGTLLGAAGLIILSFLKN